MEFMPDFSVLHPASIEEAVNLFSQNPGARYIAGGADLVVNIRRGIEAPQTLIDLSHIAEKDGFVPPAAQSQIQAGLGDNALCSLHMYDGQDRAFARVGGENYNQSAAGLANSRTAAFFKANLS